MRPLAAFGLLLVFAGCVSTGPDTTPSPLPPPDDSATVDRDVWVVNTELGSITILLYPEAAPKTVELFRAYAKENYYNGREFLRVVPGHVIQITDRAGGATDDSRRAPLEVSPDFHFSAGAVGIARDVDPNSGGPEFFIMDYATSHLDGNYTVFGQVITGLDVVHKIARVPAVEGNKAPPPISGSVPFDRMAVDGAAITSTKIESRNFETEQLSRFPMNVSKNVRLGEFRHSAEYPRTLAAGGASDLTWYVRPYNTSVPPKTADVQIRINETLMATTGNANADGVFHFSWTPPSPGIFNATFVVAGTDWTTLQVPVAAAVAPSPFMS